MSPQSNSQAEEAIENADESDESTGQVELKTFMFFTRVDPGCNINSDRQGASRSESNRSIKYKALKPKSNPNTLSNKSNNLKAPSNSNLKESQTLQKISREALLSDKSIIVGKRVKVPFPGKGNYVCKLEKYNQDGDTYTLSHPEDNWSGDMSYQLLITQRQQILQKKNDDIS